MVVGSSLGGESSGVVLSGAAMVVAEVAESFTLGVSSPVGEDRGRSSASAAMAQWRQVAVSCGVDVDVDVLARRESNVERPLGIYRYFVCRVKEIFRPSNSHPSILTTSSNWKLGTSKGGVNF